MQGLHDEGELLSFPSQAAGVKVLFFRAMLLPVGREGMNQGDSQWDRSKVPVQFRSASCEFPPTTDNIN